MRQMIAAALRRAVSLSGALDGYEHPELVETIFQKTMAYVPSGPWPEMQGASSVLDFGGGCGVHYKQARCSAKWAIVETPAMVRRATELETDRLRFFTSIGDAAHWLGDVDVMHSDGALQYAPSPEETLKELCGLCAKAMYWARVTLSDNQTKRTTGLSLLGENGPGAGNSFTGRAVRYTRTDIPEANFFAAHGAYQLTARGPDWFRFHNTRMI